MSAGFRRAIFLALIAAMATFAGCGGGGSSSDSGTAPPADSGTALPARTLSWEPPTTYVDGSEIVPERDLERIEIYVNDRGEPFTDNDYRADVSAATNSFNLANIANTDPPLTVGPIYYVSLRAVALTTGLKSEFSPPVSFSF